MAWSLAMRMYAGMVVSPAICEARNLRSPEINWYWSYPIFLTVTGWMMPCSLMELARSSRACVSKSVRGWKGLATICETGMLLTEPATAVSAFLFDVISVSAFSSNALNPLPRALRLFGVLIVNLRFSMDDLSARGGPGFGWRFCD